MRGTVSDSPFLWSQLTHRPSIDDDAATDIGVTQGKLQQRHGRGRRGAGGQQGQPQAAGPDVLDHSMPEAGRPANGLTCSGKGISCARGTKALATCYLMHQAVRGGMCLIPPGTRSILRHVTPFAGLLASGIL